MFKILPSRNNTEPANSDEDIEKNWQCNRVLTKYRRGSGLLRIEEASPTYLQLSLNPMPQKKKKQLQDMYLNWKRAIESNELVSQC
jgi:hypothetical protein